MNDNAKFHPFTPSWYENDISLLLTNLKWDLFEKCEFLGNGHDWTRLIQNLCQDQQPNILTELEFDSEADMFCVRCASENTALELSKLISVFYDDDKILEENIIKYAQYS